MKRILKVTILLFIFTLVISSFNVSAVIRNIGVTVTVPALKLKVTCSRGDIKETDSRQYFRTSVSKYTDSNMNALIQVQTYNQTAGKYSDFIHAPVGQLVTIPNGNNITPGAVYNLIAQNTEFQVITVNFGGVWNIDR